MTKNADSKGRVTLGNAFANRTVIVESISDGEVLVKLARVIPEREAWLFKNGEALDSVRRGIAEARALRFSKNPPDLKGDSILADSVRDEE